MYKLQNIKSRKNNAWGSCCPYQDLRCILFLVFLFVFFFLGLPYSYKICLELCCENNVNYFYVRRNFYIKYNLPCHNVNLSFFSFYDLFTDQPSITFISENQTVHEGDLLLPNCSASGIPPPSITWTRLSNNRNVDMPFTITGKQDEGGYICTADNKVGNPATSVVFVTVECKSQLL